MELVQRFSRSVGKRGAVATIRMGFRNYHYLIPRRQKPDAFDRRYGTDTASAVAAAELFGRSEPHANRYDPVSENLFPRLMPHIPQPSRFAFVDLGSGKGKALMLAANYPFREIIGVELSPRLHAIAQSNLQKIGDSRIRVYCEDARSFLFPSPSVIYLYNPFERPVSDAVADAIAAQNVSGYIVCYGPMDRRPFLAIGREVTSHSDFVLLERAPAGSRPAV